MLTEYDKSLLSVCQFAKDRDTLAYLLRKAETEECANSIRNMMRVFTNGKDV